VRFAATSPQIKLRPVQCRGYVAERVRRKFTSPSKLAGFEKTEISRAIENDVVQ
jgi:hypothetical protein